MAATTKRLPRFCAEATVEVEIDPDDLHHEGWHHEDECPAAPVQKAMARQAAPRERVTFLEAITSLHRQAHLSQPPGLVTCHEEPCRSLTLDQLLAGA